LASTRETLISDPTMLELKLKTTSGNFPSNRSAVENQQPRKQLLALALLLVTFAALIAKDRDFWFGSDDSSDADVVSADSSQPAPAQTAHNGVPAPALAVKKQTKTQIASTQTAAKQAAPAPQPADSGLVATDRTAVPPLDVEVVAGDKHSKLHPGSNSTNLEITSTAPAAPATNAAERVPMSTTVQSAAIPSGSIQGGSIGDSYPMLAQQMKVQGSVVLQAIIGADGNIQDLRVITGPAILTSAAQQAVRQWRFKPYLQNGHAVETKARITVNFTINVGDNSPKIS
jgi:TonB family protein